MTKRKKSEKGTVTPDKEANLQDGTMEGAEGTTAGMQAGMIGTDVLQEEITKLKDELSAFNDRYLRLYSDFDNYRKRTVKERADLLKTASSGLITQLLPVLDDFDRARRSIETATEIDALREGVELIHNKLKKILEQKGLEEIRSVGEPFDTDLHEAITNLPVEDESMKGKVVEEIEKGYLLNGTVIRFARVAVGN